MDSLPVSVLPETICTSEALIVNDTLAVNDIEVQFDTLQQTLTKFKTNITDLQQQLRTLEKSVKKETKEVKKKEPVMRQPKITGFDIQEKIKPELCQFMQLPPESTSTRNAVTSYITEYIKQNKLQDMTDRKCINTNETLAALFQLTTEKPQLTYFNLHKHISGLFQRT